MGTYEKSTINYNTSNKKEKFSNFTRIREKAGTTDYYMGMVDEYNAIDSY
jgi:hypothetical protein